MRIIYNDNDKGAAAWLSELGRTGAIPRGRVITTSITELEPGNVAQADQVHFFAGIGGWAHALELAGCADLRCWTGSPPCQPFSVAGQQRGKDDARHLAPAWLNLVRERLPPSLFGEQVADAIRHGWLDDLFNALEECGYACGAAVLPACSVGAPHIRKRLFFGAVRVADSVPAGRPEWRSQSGGRQAPRRSGISGMADTERRASERYRHEVDGTPGSVQSASRKQRFRPDVGDDVIVDRMANADDTRPQRWPGMSECSHEQPAGPGSVESRSADPHNSFWSGADWLGCRDGKFRPVEPGTQPLAHGLPKGMVRGSIQSLEEQPAAARVMRLRGYGNAIVPQVAATFITCFMESVAECV